MREMTADDLRAAADLLDLNAENPRIVLTCGLNSCSQTVDITSTALTDWELYDKPPVGELEKQKPPGRYALEEQDTGPHLFAFYWQPDGIAAYCCQEHIVAEQL